MQELLSRIPVCLWPTVTDFPILILSVKSEWELLKYGVYCLVSKNFNTPLQSFEIQLNLKMATIGRLQVSDGNENLNQTQFVMKPCACMYLVNEKSLFSPHLQLLLTFQLFSL